jgi:hypothetical protein
MMKLPELHHHHYKTPRRKYWRPAASHRNGSPNQPVLVANQLELTIAMNQMTHETILEPANALILTIRKKVS